MKKSRMKKLYREEQIKSEVGNLKSTFIESEHKSCDAQTAMTRSISEANM
jgi:hypothetical protein